MEKRPVQCTVHPSISVSAVSTHPTPPSQPPASVPSKPGLIIVDVSFPNALHSDIDEIHLTNYYTASLSVFARPRRQGEPLRRSTGSAAEWSRCVGRRVLMPEPHCESGGEGRLVLRPEGVAPLRNISELRFVLRQPAPCWKEFGIRDIKIYRYISRQPSEDDQLSAWLAVVSDATEDTDSMAEDKSLAAAGVGSIPDLSAALQKLWALTLCAAEARRASTKISRYDVDGCYDINLLSTTSKQAQ